MSAVRLIASVIVRNELARYLEPCLAHLLAFCDEVRVLDNGSTDGWADVVRDDRLIVRRDPPHDDAAFTGHAMARQRLLDFTLEGDPTHVLAIDADEFVDDGDAVRRACEENLDAWGLCMQEVWGASEDEISLRQDGGWSEHDVFMLWRPDRIRGPLRIIDRGPATGRTPDGVRSAAHGWACAACLHFGWASRATRQARYDRYVAADGGRFHAKAHLDSILLEDVTLTARAWPTALLGARDQLLSRCLE